MRGHIKKRAKHSYSVSADASGSRSRVPSVTLSDDWQNSCTSLIVGRSSTRAGLPLLTTFATGWLTMPSPTSRRGRTSGTSALQNGP